MANPQGFTNPGNPLDFEDDDPEEGALDEEDELDGAPTNPRQRQPNGRHSNRLTALLLFGGVVVLVLLVLSGVWAASRLISFSGNGGETPAAETITPTQLNPTPTNSPTPVTPTTVIITLTVGQKAPVADVCGGVWDVSADQDLAPGEVVYVTIGEGDCATLIEMVGFATP